MKAVIVSTALQICKKRSVFSLFNTDETTRFSMFKEGERFICFKRPKFLETLRDNIRFMSYVINEELTSGNLLFLASINTTQRNEVIKHSWQKLRGWSTYSRFEDASGIIRFGTKTEVGKLFMLGDLQCIEGRFKFESEWLCTINCVAKTRPQDLEVLGSQITIEVAGFIFKYDLNLNAQIPSFVRQEDEAYEMDSVIYGFRVRCTDYVERNS